MFELSKEYIKIYIANFRISIGDYCKKSPKYFCLILYYGFAIHLPRSYHPFSFKLSTPIRYYLCKIIFEKCGKNVNIETGAKFGNGLAIRIGDNSGLGINCNIFQNVIIGNDVMMGPDVIIQTVSHNFDDVNVPMWTQGTKPTEKVIIEDDVWIGARVIILPGVRIGKGSIIGAGAVVTKSCREYSIIGGVPAKLIRYRK